MNSYNVYYNHNSIWETDVLTSDESDDDYWNKNESKMNQKLACDKNKLEKPECENNESNGFYNIIMLIGIVFIFILMLDLKKV